jgi:hypothetical protein
MTIPLYVYVQMYNDPLGVKPGLRCVTIFNSMTVPLYVYVQMYNDPLGVKPKLPRLLLYHSFLPFLPGFDFSCQVYDPPSCFDSAAIWGHLKVSLPPNSSSSLKYGPL